MKTKESSIAIGEPYFCHGGIPGPVLRISIPSCKVLRLRRLQVTWFLLMYRVPLGSYMLCSLTVCLTDDLKNLNGT